MSDKKVLFRKVTELIKLQRLATQKELYEKLELTEGQFQGMRRGASYPTNEIFNKLDELFPGILEKAKEELSSKVENEEEDSASCREQLAMMKFKLSTQEQVLDVLKKQVDIQNKVIEQMEEHIENYKDKLEKAEIAHAETLKKLYTEEEAHIEYEKRLKELEELKKRSGDE